jgi:hypothetical protein
MSCFSNTDGNMAYSSSETASSVFPKFQPGCRLDTKLEAEIALNDPVQTAAVEVAVADCAEVLVVVSVVVVALVVVTTDVVVGTAGGCPWDTLIIPLQYVSTYKANYKVTCWHWRTRIL